MTAEGTSELVPFPISTIVATLLQVRQFAEDLKARVDFLACEGAQTLGAEAFADKRSHHAAVEHGAFQDFAVDLLLGSQIAHESSGEGITGARRVLYFFDR